MKNKTKSEDEIYETILPTWKEMKPSVEAQTIRAGISFYGYIEDDLPDWVWLIADIAAQRAFNQAGFKTTPSVKKVKE